MMLTLILVAGLAGAGAGAAPAPAAGRITKFTGATVTYYENKQPKRVSVEEFRNLVDPTLALVEDQTGCDRPKVRFKDSATTVEVRNFDVVTSGRPPCGCKPLPASALAGGVPAGSSVSPGRGAGMGGGFSEGAVACATP